jgi:hypothetical protein
LATAQYRRSTICEAIQFLSADHEHVQEIIDFVGLPVSVDYKTEGIQLRVIRGALDVAVAHTGDYVIKHQNGKIEAVKQAEFESLYEPVGS